MSGEVILILIFIGLVWLTFMAGREPKKCKIAPIYFCYLSCNVIFRYDEDWWQKNNCSTAISSKGNKKEIASLTVVGVLLDDLTTDDYKFILNDN